MRITGCTRSRRCALTARTCTRCCRCRRCDRAGATGATAEGGARGACEIAPRPEPVGPRPDRYGRHNDSLRWLRCKSPPSAPPGSLAVALDPPLHETFAFIRRRNARLSPATRALMTLAEQSLIELATTSP